MDFFAHQVRARRRTGQLIVLFALAVLGIIAAVYGVVLLALTLAGAGHGPSAWQPELLLLAGGGTLLLVGLGSTYKIAQLRSGGPAVAQLLGGRALQPNTRDADEKRLRNVVEEMAVASGIPVPGVYLLDGEDSINAFAAGHGPSDAIVGVTRGGVARLSRDELQGVVAHEFSHILNGDMRLNLRLIGLLHGILCLALAGSILLRGLRHVRVGSGRGKGGGAVAAIAILGGGLWLVGSIGVLLARLIQAAVSRQREFLADASAVQLTRNPLGIGGALKKIAGFAGGARIRSPQAAATGHLFFGNALRPALLDALATHPPLEERIRRIDKGWQPERPPEGAPAEALAGAAGLQAFAAARLTPAEVVARTGQPREQELAHAHAVLRELPLAIAAAVREPFAARALVLALLLDRSADLRRVQIERISRLVDAPTAHETVVLAAHVKDLGDGRRLPLLDLALPALRQMSPAQHLAFQRAIQALVEADAELSLFELTLQQVLRRHLAGHFAPPRLLPVRSLSTGAMLDAAHQLLSCLAHHGHADPAAAAEAFRNGQRSLPQDGYRRDLLEPAACGLSSLAQVLERLAASDPASKRGLLRACAEVVAHDGIVQPAEAELLRAIADALACP